MASADGTTSSVQVTINGTNDAAVLSTASVSLVETNTALSTGGTLTVTDVDSAQSFVAQANVAGANGTFSIAASGAWTYTANSAFDNLNVGQSVSDMFTVTAADGTTSTVQVTINGTNDAAVVSSATVVLAETNAPLTTGGTLTISDVDNAQSFVPQTNVAGANGTFSIAANGAWTYTANSAFDYLNVGQSVSDTFTVAAADGTATTVQVTILGTDEVAVLASQSTPRAPVGASQGTTATASAPVAAPIVPAAEPAGAVAPPAAAIPLGLPVDSAVAASNLWAQPTVPAVLWPDTNLVSADADKSSVVGGFPVVRIQPEQAGIIRVSDLDELSKFVGAGQRLFVYRGIPDMQILGDGSQPLFVPRDAFAHTDPQAMVMLQARLANGAPLPAWLKFDSLRGEFVGSPPGLEQGTVEVEVIARDTEGREAHAWFTLQFGDLRATETAPRPDPDSLALGMDVDKKEAEKARLEAARQAPPPGEPAAKGTAPRAEKHGAASFSEQVRAAKGRDPLLERIARTREER